MKDFLLINQKYFDNILYMNYNNNLIIVFDTETTGFSPEKNEIVQLSYILYDIEKKEVVYATKPGEDIINIKGNIPKNTSNVHGITKDMTLDKRPIREHIDEFIYYCNQASRFVGHNIKFDIKMICGQMIKIINEYPETEESYKLFLEKFSMIGNELPEAAYCTMMESQGICAEILRTNKLKNKKLMEVHKLLFNQDVAGQLHNALVDISVTLRVYLKLTMDIDICESMNEFSSNVESVTNNYTICSLINPVSISKPIENVDYSGELITGLNMKIQDIEEEKIIVETFAKKFISDITKRAITNVTERIAPKEIICTNIIICKAILKSGKRKGEVCSRPLKGTAEFCNYHKPTTNIKINPEINTIEDKNINLPIKMKPTSQDINKISVDYVSNLLNKFTKKNKVAVLGGKRNIRNTRKGKGIKRRTTKNKNK
jgi:DNA polymerase III epsilon subunit-like protein